MTAFETKILPFPGTALNLLQIFKDRRHVFCFDSSNDDEESAGRFSFLGFDPHLVVSSKGKNSLNRLKKTFNKFNAKIESPHTPFPCGMAGVLGYDAGLYFEKISLNTKDDLHLPDCVFGVYDTILTVDHKLNKLILTSSSLPGEDEAMGKKKAQKKIASIENRVRNLKLKSTQSALRDSPSHTKNIFRSDFSENTYCKAVREILEHIKQGNIYQANLAQRFEFPFEASTDPVVLYQRLRELSPSDFGGYFDGESFKLLSTSPERFIKVVQNYIETKPMKGTRPRGKDNREDQNLKEELVKSPKEKAELLMITDLERNDLGRVCQFGSVRVKEMRKVEKYKTVFQTTSTVVGRLQKKIDFFDILKACFPGGSITGCPKIRAMEIIGEIEPVRRGFYTGAMGYMSFSENMDFNVLIRTLLYTNNKMFFHVGSGIVADSDPQMEYAETLVKAKALMQALRERN